MGTHAGKPIATAVNLPRRVVLLVAEAAEPQSMLSSPLTLMTSAAMMVPEHGIFRDVSSHGGMIGHSLSMMLVRPARVRSVGSASLAARLSAFRLPNLAWVPITTKQLLYFLLKGLAL